MAKVPQKPNLGEILRRRGRSVSTWVEEFNLLSRENAIAFLQTLETQFTISESFKDEVIALFPKKTAVPSLSLVKDADEVVEEDDTIEAVTDETEAPTVRTSTKKGTKKRKP